MIVDRALAVPFGRQGPGWEVTYAALFLISNEFSYVNAHTLFLDGGHIAGVVRGWSALADGSRHCTARRNAQL